MRIILAGLALLMSMGLSVSAQGQNRMAIKGVEPKEIFPGNTFEITGDHFGARQPNKTSVMISGTVAARPYRYKLVRQSYSSASPCQAQSRPVRGAYLL